MSVSKYREEKVARMQAMFAAIAGRYDLINRLLSLWRDNGWRRFAASRLIQNGGLVLDVATGTAELARCIVNQNGVSSVVGIDICPEMLFKAREKLVDYFESGRIKLILADVMKLPFAENTFDAATIGFGLRNVADINATFSEMRRVVKPGGRVISLELTRPHSQSARFIHRLWLSHMAPLIGGLLAGNRGAYKYLPDSIQDFPPPEEIEKIMREAGLDEIQTYSLALGAATVHQGIKNY